MLTPQQVLDHYFLENRCMLLEIAATLDRYDAARERSEDSGNGDARLERIYQSLGVLADRKSATDRTERLLRLFSDPTL
jgi:hypothetical protein